MVVFHYSNEPLEKFNGSFNNYFSEFKKGIKNAIFFTDNEKPKKGTILDREFQLTCELSYKTIKIIKGTKEDLHKQGLSFTGEINRAYLEGYDSIRFVGIDDNQELMQNITIVFNPKNVKILKIKKR
jgi:hypothetical protein